ncbi:hypothetical protein T484DRAFT_1757335 [Baffinella frigidus]|nr:hypothetical protein T484DRAFT_1757335 [Cryptophyta sp. CCMP2293]
MWAITTILCSCVLNVALNTLVAFSSKQSVIEAPSTPEGTKPDSGTTGMHKSVAQGHCSVVAIILALHAIMMQQSLVDLNWASAFYPSSPGLVWIVGTATLAFLTVLFITAIAGAWAATAVGDSNPIFFILPTTSIICIMFPVINEIGNNGLMACSSPMVSTFAIIYANLALATSFTLSLLDNVEFDPVRLLPKMMRTVGDRAAYVRIYCLLHGVCISGTMVVYWMSARKVGTVTVFTLIILNGIVTLTNSMPFIAVLMRMSSIGGVSTSGSDARGLGSDSGSSGNGSDSNQDSGSDSASSPQSGSNSGSENSKTRRTKPSRTMPTVSAGPKRRNTPAQSSAMFTNQKPNFQWPLMGTTHTNPPQFGPAGMSVAERRIAILRLNEDPNRRTRHT